MEWSRNSAEALPEGIKGGPAAWAVGIFSWSADQKRDIVYYKRVAKASTSLLLLMLFFLPYSLSAPPPSNWEKGQCCLASPRAYQSCVTLIFGQRLWQISTHIPCVATPETPEALGTGRREWGLHATQVYTLKLLSETKSISLFFPSAEADKMPPSWINQQGEKRWERREEEMLSLDDWMRQGQDSQSTTFPLTLPSLSLFLLNFPSHNWKMQKSKCRAETRESTHIYVIPWAKQAAGGGGEGREAVACHLIIDSLGCFYLCSILNRNHNGSGSFSLIWKRIAPQKLRHFRSRKYPTHLTFCATLTSNV